MVTTKCRSKNPASCRYHGSLEVHTQQLKVAYDNYINQLRESLTGDSSASATKLEKHRVAFADAQASFDSHDENYHRLVFELENQQKVVEKDEPMPGSWAWQENKDNLKELQERVVLAEKIRAKRAEGETPEDLGWTSDYTSYLPLGTKISSGETVIAVRRRFGLPASKREVVLQNDKGERKAYIWNAHTKINHLPLEAQQQNWAPNMVPEKMENFASKIRNVWDQKTSTAGDAWSPYRPEKGQCAVTALLVQDSYGGTLNRALVNGESHYWNTLPDGTEVDLTRAQFDQPITIEEPQKRERDYLFSSEATVKRYNELKERLENN